MAYDGYTTSAPRSERGFRPLDLSDQEKAMLFDLAMDSANAGHDLSSDINRHAAVIAAFARAYVLIRDREQGIV